MCMPVQCYVTYYISPSLNQYLSLSGGCAVVPVMDRVTGLGRNDVSALLFDNGLLLALFGMTFK